MLDIDHFKKVNDQYGHLAGDDVLEELARLIRQNIRDVDAVGRYGGEEFIIILPKTDLSSALNVTERIRKAIEMAGIKDSEGNVFSITVSQGLASYKPGEDKHSFISRADDALYAAKENGRNRVETYGIENLELKIDDRKEIRNQSSIVNLQSSIERQSSIEKGVENDNVGSKKSH
ncbi:MAG: GGDEF domain-containing protein, partial [Desulfobacterales bacterium]|nr:GGDEF domain-containing protein [Desulfobacterales bacterium]